MELGVVLSKRKDRKHVAALYDRVSRLAEGGEGPSPEAPVRLRPKRFRAQLLHAWMVANLPPGRVADVGGGKGLLSYLLQESGWSATVIDPHAQPLPEKYPDLATGRTVPISPTAAVPYRAEPFRGELAQDFDLLVSLHAHGCTIKVLEAAAAYGRAALVVPCCIIDEPIVPAPGVHWLECVAEYAVERGLRVTPLRLGFSGQAIGLYARAG